jgi:hypothetical protein
MKDSLVEQRVTIAFEKLIGLKVERPSRALETPQTAAL